MRIQTKNNEPHLSCNQKYFYAPVILWMCVAFVEECEWLYPSTKPNFVCLLIKKGEGGQVEKQKVLLHVNQA